MVLTLTRYRIKDMPTGAGRDMLLKEMRTYHLNHGCLYYDWVSDCFDEHFMLEIARFGTQESADRFREMHSDEKRSLYDRFFSDYHVVEKSEEEVFV